ncbi:MAG: hypothetical protein JNL79_11350 [Myxococcales bacterium]|jgi:hypothetical protein|nr:hypothetical protein [Myxococcales bacterium]
MTDEAKKQSLSRVRGLAALVRDAVEHGSRAVEKVHLEIAKRPFTVLEHVPGIEAPSRAVHVVHDLTVQSVYGSIRLVNGLVGTTVEAALNAVEQKP